MNSNPDQPILERLETLENAIKKNHDSIARAVNEVCYIKELLLAVAKKQAGLIDADRLKRVIEAIEKT
jgi:hypothetical protein